ncbi:MarR family winged helix-turn-helix transcriptional regulator [Kibdelosporangium phytohabitans]|uniref:MarR family transcriptional regulator n=1 Tax=Kibdelosporangium phytohabitans TaxID=860235 RepID=A0A0N9I7Y7_9PSEU|nr:MarR family transcriptional regulator [Kibdelosporangium phytohabitans]ALG11965.1 MarR family transcriptional regulator [Kibdelosporangium phytohabitans]MBE1463430.1 DNA-binding MarR family transcriptional regulator [Kibdelosporangium phytohabitans]
MRNASGDDATLVRLLRQFNVESDQFTRLFGDAHGLHRTDMNALVIVMEATRRGRPITPGELARALHLSASATTTVLDRLVAAGHVRRDRDQADRRRIELVTSPTAMKAGERFFRPLGVELSHAWRDFSDDERAVIARFLTASVEAAAHARAKLSQRTTAGEEAF